MRSFIGLFLLSVTFMLGLGFDKLIWIVDWPSIQFLLLSLLGIFIIIFDFKTLVRALLGMVSLNFKNESDHENCINVAKVGIVASILASLGATIIGFFLLAINVQNLKMEDHGYSLGVAVIPFIYGSFLSLLFTAGLYRAKSVKVKTIAEIFD